MRQKTDYNIRICSDENLSKRCFIEIKIQGKRYKEYTGKKLKLDIEPNRSSTLKERDKLLKILEFEFRKVLEENRYLDGLDDNIEIAEVTAFSTGVVLKAALDQKLSSNLNSFYLKNLKYLYKHFIDFLTPKELQDDIRNLKPSRIQDFLLKYRSSGTYYMDKRRELGVLFSAVGKQLDIQLLTVKKTDRMKSKAKLHKIYDKKQLLGVLDYLKINHDHLYLCCLLSYGCFLRPHREVRNLCVYHFKKDYTEIHLSGDENKSGRIRIVPIPDYVREVLIKKVEGLEYTDNIFSRKPQPFNEAYFNTAWTRMWHKMNKEGIIESEQTIYSFRHSAAIFVYRQTKDVHIVQQVLGHSDMIVTLKYLRGLGELNLTEQKQYMPTLK